MLYLVLHSGYTRNPLGICSTYTASLLDAQAEVTPEVGNFHFEEYESSGLANEVVADHHGARRSQQSADEMPLRLAEFIKQIRGTNNATSLQLVMNPSRLNGIILNVLESRGLEFTGKVLNGYTLAPDGLDIEVRCPAYGYESCLHEVRRMSESLRWSLQRNLEDPFELASVSERAPSYATAFLAEYIRRAHRMHNFGGVALLEGKNRSHYVWVVLDNASEQHRPVPMRPATSAGISQLHDERLAVAEETGLQLPNSSLKRIIMASELFSL